MVNTIRNRASVSPPSAEWTHIHGVPVPPDPLDRGGTRGNRTSFQFRLLPCCVLIGVLSACLQNNYRVELWNGYKLVKSNSSEKDIVDPNGVVVVEGNIIRLGFRKPWIAGERKEPDGFFLLNTQSGELVLKLSRAEIESTMLQKGLGRENISVSVDRLLKIPK